MAGSYDSGTTRRGVASARREPIAYKALEANISAAREVAQRDPMRYADLSANFSLLITQYCGSQTIHVLAGLIHDIIRHQHEHVTKGTLAKAGVDKLRLRSIRDRETALELMRSGKSADAERFWRAHIEHMRHLVMSVYKPPMTLDVLSDVSGNLRQVRNVKRHSRPPAKAA